MVINLHIYVNKQTMKSFVQEVSNRSDNQDNFHHVLALCEGWAV